jgi:hypothetical protein
MLPTITLMGESNFQDVEANYNTIHARCAQLHTCEIAATEQRRDFLNTIELYKSVCGEMQRCRTLPYIYLLPRAVRMCDANFENSDCVHAV